ncbi:hypothetical protein RB595_008958 [Gaeumannomyces hyphopodioides]
MWRLEDVVTAPFEAGLGVYQWIANKVLAPRPPPPNGHAPADRPRIAVIGAGITGVSAAAQCVGHGFDVVIFEAGPRSGLGGIWTSVNDSSKLQIHSAMYRFHPSVRWSRGYPNKDEILAQVGGVWSRYGLEARTVFDAKVATASQDAKGRWVINDDPSLGRFEGLIAAVGTCGEPKMPHIQGMDDFEGEIYHSSQLSDKSPKGKNVAIIGGGASAVEALEWAFDQGAAHTTIISRSDKWIIPRNLLVDVLLSWNILGQETIFSWIPELLLRKLFYRDLEELSPPEDKGIFTDTPMVNSEVMRHLRSGRAEWVRCDIEGFVRDGVAVKQRARGVPAGGPGKERHVDADIVVMATGFKRPSLAFLPDDCFEDPYGPPNWYLQTFPPMHPSVSAINCTYVSAIGTVGNWHIGIYTRMLLMFLVDPFTRPAPWWMRRWIDMTKVLKAAGPTSAFDFFTYLELVWWFVFCISFNPFRWKWALFVFLGVGLAVPDKVADLETRLMLRAGWDRREEGKDEGKSF